MQGLLSTKVGQILIETGKITPAQLTDAMALQQSTRKPVGEILRELGHVNEEDLARALANQVGVEFLDLGEDFRLSREEVALLPETVARRYCMFVIRRNTDPVVTAVMRDPLDLDAIDTVRSLTRLEVRKAVSTEQRILQTIGRFYREDAHIEQNLRDLVDDGSTQIETAVPGDGAVDSDQLRVMANDAPVVRFVNLLLMNAVRDGASDIHFEPSEKKSLSACAWTATCGKSRHRPRPCTRPSSRASRSSPTWTSPSDASRWTAGSSSPCRTG